MLAGELIRVLRPWGTLLGFFSGGGPDDRCYTKYVIEDDTRLRLRFYGAACSRSRVLQNRDISNLFAGLELFGSVLLKSGVREVKTPRAWTRREGETVQHEAVWEAWRKVRVVRSAA